VKAYLDQTVAKARKDGFVSTAFKRRRYIPEILSQNNQIKSFAERTAINAPIQGTASDIIKIAMCRIAEKLEHQKSAAKMILQVHDELVFEAPKEGVEELVQMVRREMEGAVSFEVPMSVSVKAGSNWLEMEEI
jgi:DNA polymerase-1